MEPASQVVKLTGGFDLVRKVKNNRKLLRSCPASTKLDAIHEGLIMAVRKRKANGPTSPPLKHVYKRFVAGNAEQEGVYTEHLANAEVARRLVDLREHAGLSQRELAKLVGTSASVICRLEDADYQGHSLSMLQRIAAVLDKRVEIRFVSLKRTRQPA